MKTTTIILSGFSCILLVSCFKEDAYNNPSPDKIINFTISDQTIAADAISTVSIKVKISEDAAPDRRKVVFKTSLGSFVNGVGDSIVVTVGSNYEASANLLSVIAAEATVSASIQSVKALNEPKVTFSKAFPDIISVLVDSFVIYNNFSSETLITSTLSKTNGGKPSRGHLVSFQVTDLSGNPLGTFLNGISTSTTNNDGKASVRYSAGPISYLGFLIIRATTQKEDGSQISITTQIYLSH